MTTQEHMLGYSVHAAGGKGCVEEIVQCITEGHRFQWLACLNPHGYAVALRDQPFADALRSADWLVPDGVGIVLASRCFGGRIRERVTGSDIFRALHERLSEEGEYTVFFLGSTDETLARIRERMNIEFPRMKVVGTYSPPFKAAFTSSDIEDMLSAINDAAPDILWVGMTAPKQEKWINANKTRLNVKFAGAIGAVFDFYTGRIKRSHPAFQRAGLEWFPRLLREPTRLWQRMFVSAPIFMWHVLRHRFYLLTVPRQGD